MPKISETTEKKRQGINSIEIGIGILKALETKKASASLGEIADLEGMQPAKVHRYLVSLIRTGLVQQNAQTGRYELGPYALTFSLSCLSRLEPIQVISPYLSTLASELNESVFVAVWSNNGPVVVDWKPSNQPISASTRTGTVFPILMSSTGRTYAAYMPRVQSDHLIADELEKLTGGGLHNAPTTVDEVNSIFEQIREKGIGQGLGIRQPGINSFTVPVFNFRREIECVITSFGYATTFNTDWDGPIASKLKEAGEKLSRQLGNPA